MARSRHLQKLALCGVIMPKVPNWMAHADRLAYLEELRVQELGRDGIQVLGQLPCLMYLQLRAKTIPEKNIIIHPNTVPSLKHFDFSCELSFLTFEPSAMPWLQILNIDLDGREEGTMQLPEGSPVGGIENLASLEKIYLLIRAKCVRRQPRRLKVESACREAIRRHLKSQSMLIYSVYCNEFDEIGHEVQGSQED